MGTYLYIPIIALFCYIFLFTTMLAAKKDRIINAFLLMLGAMILWTGGSMLMRMQLWPGVKFWYDVSISGLLLLGYALFNFAYEFVGCRYKIFKRFWFLCFLLMNIINIATGVFLSAPQTHLLEDGRIEFIYNVQWPVVFLFIYCAAIVGHMFYLLFRHINKNEISHRQFTPILIGIFVMFAGHFAFLIPAFDGFPIDIIAGVLNAGCMFYALYCRRLFKLTLLASRGSCYALSAGMSIIIFINLLGPITSFVEEQFPMFAEYNVLIIALTFTIATWLIYSILKKFIDKVFVKEEILQAENLKTFSLSVSKSLNIDEINSHMIDVIMKTLPVKRIYICYYNKKTGLYSIVCSNRPLDKRNLGLGTDNPLIKRLKSYDDCVIMSEFKRTTAYRSMWEKEKKQLDELNIECFAPLKEDNENLQGFVMLSAKDKNHAYTCEDVNFLSSVNSISSIAIKNSRLYERAYLEARTDELTGLLNRKYFYETINEEYEKKQRSGTFSYYS